jgi:hemerythrin-like domain-containing protein
MPPLAPALPGFDQPLDLLHACHVRIGTRCALLMRLCDHIREHGCDEQARKTAGHILRYFDEAGHQHHEDEENDLFPALVAAVPDARREEVSALTRSLEQEHDELERVYAEIRPHLEGVSEGRLPDLDVHLCDRLHTLYLEHIEREEAELLPLAREHLGEDAIARLGSGMAARRNVAFPPRLGD